MLGEGAKKMKHVSFGEGGWGGPTKKKMFITFFFRKQTVIEAHHQLIKESSILFVYLYVPFVFVFVFGFVFVFALVVLRTRHADSEL